MQSVNGILKTKSLKLQGGVGDEDYSIHVNGNQPFDSLNISKGSNVLMQLAPQYDGIVGNDNNGSVDQSDTIIKFNTGVEFNEDVEFKGAVKFNHSASEEIPEAVKETAGSIGELTTGKVGYPYLSQQNQSNTKSPSVVFIDNGKHCTLAGTQNSFTEVINEVSDVYTRNAKCLSVIHSNDMQFLSGSSIIENCAHSSVLKYKSHKASDNNYGYIIENGDFIEYSENGFIDGTILVVTSNSGVHVYTFDNVKNSYEFIQFIELTENANSQNYYGSAHIYDTQLVTVNSSDMANFSDLTYGSVVTVVCDKKELAESKLKIEAMVVEVDATLNTIRLECDLTIHGGEGDVEHKIFSNNVLNSIVSSTRQTVAYASKERDGPTLALIDLTKIMTQFIGYTSGYVLPTYTSSKQVSEGNGLKLYRSSELKDVTLNVEQNQFPWNGSHRLEIDKREGRLLANMTNSSDAPVGDLDNLEEGTIVWDIKSDPMNLKVLTRISDQRLTGSTGFGLTHSHCFATYSSDEQISLLGIPVDKVTEKLILSVEWNGRSIALRDLTDPLNSFEISVSHNMENDANTYKGTTNMVLEHSGKFTSDKRYILSEDEDGSSDATCVLRVYWNVQYEQLRVQEVQFLEGLSQEKFDGSHYGEIKSNIPLKMRDVDFEDWFFNASYADGMLVKILRYKDGFDKSPNNLGSPFDQTFKAQVQSNMTYLESYGGVWSASAQGGYTDLAENCLLMMSGTCGVTISKFEDGSNNNIRSGKPDFEGKLANVETPRPKESVEFMIQGKPSKKTTTILTVIEDEKLRYGIHFTPELANFSDAKVVNLSATGKPNIGDTVYVVKRGGIIKSCVIESYSLDFSEKYYNNKPNSLMKNVVGAAKLSNNFSEMDDGSFAINKNGEIVGLVYRNKLSIIIKKNVSKIISEVKTYNSQVDSVQSVVSNRVEGLTNDPTSAIYAAFVNKEQNVVYPYLSGSASPYLFYPMHTFTGVENGWDEFGQLLDINGNVGKGGFEGNILQIGLSTYFTQQWNSSMALNDIWLRPPAKISLKSTDGDVENIQLGEELRGSFVQGGPAVFVVSKDVTPPYETDANGTQYKNFLVYPIARYDDVGLYVDYIQDSAFSSSPGTVHIPKGLPDGEDNTTWGHNKMTSSNSNINVEVINKWLYKENYAIDGSESPYFNTFYPTWMGSKVSPISSLMYTAVGYPPNKSVPSDEYAKRGSNALLKYTDYSPLADNNLSILNFKNSKNAFSMLSLEIELKPYGLVVVKDFKNLNCPLNSVIKLVQGKNLFENFAEEISMKPVGTEVVLTFEDGTTHTRPTTLFTETLAIGAI